MASNERKVYVNGRFVPESEATISIFDVGYLYGATVYESLRSFNHEWYLLDEHWLRLKSSLAYMEMTSAVSRQEFGDMLHQTLQANVHLTHPDDDVWANFQVTPGKTFPMPLVEQKPGSATIMCYTSALPHAEYAMYYTKGKHVVTSLYRSPPPQSYDQRIKNRSRLPHFMSKRYAARIDADAFAMMLDVDGNIAEGTGANIFFVRDGVLYTPTARNILVGISRQQVIRLAKQLDVPLVETDMSVYDAYSAEEAFWTTSSYCILPISMIDGRAIGDRYPGPVASQLLRAWSEEVGVDIVAQSQKFACAQ